MLFKNKLQYSLISNKVVLNYYFKDKNKYIYHLWVSEAEFREILRYFCLDIKTVKIAEICNIFRNTVNKIIKTDKNFNNECEKNI